MEGDLLRRIGDKKLALLEYQKAARLEELSFGRDNPDLAFLHRKIACLTSMKKSALLTIDFDEKTQTENKTPSP